eukprot:NODE_919_length_3055_cov_0.512855.p1 type:complete len:347 gc:universal NODE_919_length_3055_cov_0.512855:529-1569(+)
MDLILKLKKDFDENISIFELYGEYKGPDFLKLFNRILKKLVLKAKDMTSNGLYVETHYDYLKDESDINSNSAHIVDVLGGVLQMPISHEEATELQTNLLITSDKEKLNEALRFLLSDPAEHSKKLYLGAYLVPVDVPPEFKSLGVIQQLQTQLNQLTEDFVTIHREYSQKHNDLEVLKQLEILTTQKEDDKRVLQQQIKVLETKYDKSSESDSWLELCKAYHRENQLFIEAKAKIQELQNIQIRECDFNKEKKDSEKFNAEKRLASPISEILNEMENELHKAEYFLQSSQKDYEFQSKVLSTLQQSLGKNITRSDVIGVEDSISRLNGDLNEATQTLLSNGYILLT